MIYEFIEIENPYKDVKSPNIKFQGLYNHLTAIYSQNNNKLIGGIFHKNSPDNYILNVYLFKNISLNDKEEFFTVIEKTYKLKNLVNDNFKDILKQLKDKKYDYLHVRIFINKQGLDNFVFGEIEINPSKCFISASRLKHLNENLKLEVPRFTYNDRENDPFISKYSNKFLKYSLLMDFVKNMSDYAPRIGFNNVDIQELIKLGCTDGDLIYFNRILNKFSKYLKTTRCNKMDDLFEIVKFINFKEFNKELMADILEKFRIKFKDFEKIHSSTSPTRFIYGIYKNVLEKLYKNYDEIKYISISNNKYFDASCVI